MNRGARNRFNYKIQQRVYSSLYIHYISICLIFGLIPKYGISYFILFQILLKIWTFPANLEEDAKDEWKQVMEALIRR